MVGRKLAGVLALGTILLCALPAPAGAGLRAYVDRNPVGLDQSFTLTLESSEDLGGSPDLSALRQDFQVLGQSKSTSIQFINGNTSRKTQWQISLMARHSGRLRIPPIRVGGEQSAPLTLTVTASSQAQAAPQRGDLFLQVSATPRSVYPQQQIIFTVRLFSAVNLANGATLSAPKLRGGADAVVEKLGKDHDYQTVRNGMGYDVVERRYAIYPQKSGRFEIAPVVFNGDIVQSGGGFFGFGVLNPNTHHRRIRSRATAISVKPIPAAFHGSQWLPAHDLELAEHWSRTPPTFTVGQPITRTLALMADGLTAAQLPPFGGGSIAGLKQYPDQAMLKDTKDRNGVTGIRTEKTAFIPTRAGSVTLPSIAIPWWNTATNKMEVARLPSRTIKVAAAPGAGAPKRLTAPAPSPAQGTLTAAPIRRTALPSPADAHGRWQWIALVLAIAWIGTLTLWWWRSRRRTSSRAPAVGGDEPLRRLERELRTACLANDAPRTKTALLTWARRRWPDRPPVNLIALARRCEPELADALVSLDRALYAPGRTTWAEGNALWQHFRRHKQAGDRRGTTRAEGLEPLYRN